MTTFNRTLLQPKLTSHISQTTLWTTALLAAAMALVPSGAAYSSSPSKASVKAVKTVKASTQTVGYSCAGNKKLKVTYSISAKGIPVKAKVTLGKTAQQLESFGKTNGFSLNFAKGDYTLSLDKKKLPVTKAPIMIFQKSKAKVSGKLRDVSGIIYRNCLPAAKATKG